MNKNVFFSLLDLAIGKIKAACEENGYVLFITSDHGNAEKMYSEQGGPHTAHTTYRGRSSSKFLMIECHFKNIVWVAP